MKKSGWIIIASVLVILGLTISVSAVFMVDFKFDSFVTNGDYTIKNTDFDVSDINSFKITTVYTDIKIVEGDGDKILVDYYESDNEHFDIEVSDDGALTVNYVDDRKWYQRIGLFMFERAPDFVLTVPADLIAEYDILSVSGDILAESLLSDGNISIISTSGNVTVSEADAEEGFFKATSGNVVCSVLYIDSLEIKTVSGDIKVEKTDSEDLSIESVSGDVRIDELSADELFAKTTSGELTLGEGNVAYGCNLVSTSGDINVGKASVGTMKASTASGDIEASKLMLSEGEFNSTSGEVDIFLAKDDRGYSINPTTTSGSVRLPDRNDGDIKISVKTVSGDIRFEIER